MISHLKGKVDSLGKDNAVIDVNGVGYIVYMTQRDISEHLAPGFQVQVQTYMAFRQEGADLFGFLSSRDREIFKLLLKVSGVGPKLALSVLSSLDASELALTIINGHAERLQAVPGVGKKTAQRLIIELKDKEELEALIVQEEAHTAGDTVSAEVVKVLESFGCTGIEAKKTVSRALKDARPGSSSQEILSLCLQILGK
jgi:holliday junction DNA helicase RuvA